jgi:hypothetical protein
MKKQIRYALEVRERAVQLVYEQQGEYESQWSAMVSIAAKIGCIRRRLCVPGCASQKQIRLFEEVCRQRIGS